MKEDPHVTKIGKTICVKSIDELPQLWNVLKGGRGTIETIKKKLILRLVVA